MTMRLLFFISAACIMLGAHVAIAEPVNRFKVAKTSSPRDTLRSFIEAANDSYDLIMESGYVDRNSPAAHALRDRILDCIDVSELPAFARRDRAVDAATALKEILDRVDLPPWDEIPDASEIQAAGGNVELSRWRMPAPPQIVGQPAQTADALREIGKLVDFAHSFTSPSSHSLFCACRPSRS